MRIPSKLSLSVRTAALLSSVLFAGALPQIAHSEAATIQAGVLTTGSDLTYPPFVYLKDGEPAGFDVEFVQAIANHMKMSAKFIDTRFANLITGIRANHFDVIASALYVTPERQKILNFVPYLKAGSSILILKTESFRPASERDLCGKVVASIQGASWLPKLTRLSDDYCAKNNLGPIQTREFDTDAQATQALRSGSVDVEFIDNTVGEKVLKNFPDQFEVTSTELIYPVLIGLAIAPQNKELLQKISEAFSAMRDDGTYAKLTQLYGMSPVSDAEINSVLSAAQ